MLGKAFGCEPGHRTLDLASLSLKFPSYRMPWASTDVPAMMFADAVAVVVQCLHFDAAAAAVAAAVDEIAVGEIYAMLINLLVAIYFKMITYSTKSLEIRGLFMFQNSENQTAQHFTSLICELTKSLL